MGFKEDCLKVRERKKGGNCCKKGNTHQNVEEEKQII